jgi:putative ABC transport system permease protein
MSLWRQVARGLRTLTHRASVDDEIDEEVRDYYERARADLVKQGHSPQEAARVARQQLGDIGRAREELRSYGWENVAEAILIDLRHALRRLRQSPGFAATAIGTLALGIGATTAIVSALWPILVEPLPYPEADRIVMLTGRTPDGAGLETAYGTYIEVAARSRSFEGLAVAQRWGAVIAGDGESELLAGDRVTADYFRVLGISPAVGRNFEASDETVGGPQFVIVSDALARRRFESARAAVNQTIRLGGVPHTVIGVMPPGFENVLAPASEVWSAMQFRAQAPFQSGEWGNQLRMIGRLETGVSIEQARDDLAAIGASRVEEFPRPEWALMERGLAIESLQGSVTSNARPVLLAIFGAVLLMLVIACANVTNLLLARSVARRSELAVRATLGAGRGRLVRQLLTESLLLAVVGGVLGLGLALAGIRGIVALAPTDLPRIDAIRLDTSAFLLALAITTLVGLAVGLIPALRGARPDLRADLHSRGRAGGSHHLLRRSLVVTEVALALVLLTSAGLLLRSVDRLLSTAPGFDASNVLTVQIDATDLRYESVTCCWVAQERSSDALLQVFQSALDAVRAVPGVESAAFTTQLPLSGDNDIYGVQFESETRPYAALRYIVTPDWFTTMGIPLLDGRLLEAGDRPGAPEAIVLSESFAKSRFGDRSPIGERLRIGPENFEPNRPWDVVVGVVGDVKQTSLGLDSPEAVYVALGQWVWVDLDQSLVVRTQGDPALLVPAIRQALGSVSADVAIARVATMEALVAASEADRRFVLQVIAIFAVAALVLAALGLYGVIAGSVAERTREIGLRSALGATRADILSLIVRQGMTLAALGVVIGLAGAAAATRGLTTLLYEVTALDPLTYGGVVVLLAAVSAAACWVPASRAARIDPTAALRAE